MIYINIIAKKFTFNGVSSTKYNVVICEFSHPDTDRETGISYSINRTDITPAKSKTYTYSKCYEDVLKFDISLCHEDGSQFTLDERRDLTAWITSPTYPALLSIEDHDGDEYHKNIEYFCTSTKYTEFIPNGDVYGMTFSMECNTPFGYAPEEITAFDLSNSGSITINNTSDEWEMDYYPYIEIKSRSEGLNTITLSNNRYPSEQMEIKLRNGQIAYIDCESGDIRDNTGLFDYDTDTNLKWLRLAHGENIISITGNVAGHFKCRYIRKVGI